MWDLWWRVPCFLRVLRFPLPILIQPNAPHSSIIRGWYKRPNSDRSTKWMQSHPNPPPKNKLHFTLFYLIRSSYTLQCRGCFFILIILQMVGLLGRVISSSQGLYLNIGQHKHRINSYTHQPFIPCVGFEPTISASERAKTVHALDRSVTVTGETKKKKTTNIKLYLENRQYELNSSCSGLGLMAFLFVYQTTNLRCLKRSREFLDRRSN
jgi:hypothetical protein